MRSKLWLFVKSYTALLSGGLKRVIAHIIPGPWGKIALSGFSYLTGRVSQPAGYWRFVSIPEIFAFQPEGNGIEG